MQKQIQNLISLVALSLICISANATSRECVAIFNDNKNQTSPPAQNIEAMPTQEVFDKIQSASLVRAQKAAATIYPVLMRRTQSPISFAEHILAPTIELMANISKFNIESTRFKADEQTSAASLVANHSDNMLQRLELLTIEINRGKKFFERLSKREAQLRKSGHALSKMIQKNDEFTKTLEAENLKLNESYAQVNGKFIQLTEEIEFLTHLIDHLNNEMNENAAVQLLASDIETHMMPIFMKAAHDMRTLRVIVYGAIENINLHLTANQKALNQMRELTQLGLPTLLKNHPELQNYINSDSAKMTNQSATYIETSIIDESIPICIRGDLCVGQSVATLDGKATGTVQGIHTSGTIRILESSGEVIEANRNNIAITSFDTKINHFMVGEIVKTWNNVEVKIIGVFPDASFLIEPNKSGIRFRTSKSNPIYKLSGQLGGYSVGQEVITDGSSLDIVGIQPIDKTFLAMVRFNKNTFTIALKDLIARDMDRK